MQGRAWDRDNFSSHIQILYAKSIDVKWSIEKYFICKNEKFTGIYPRID
jgi:hypothetical protein